MCYSAEIRVDHKRHVRELGADIKVPKVMDAAFVDPQTDEERRIKAMIAASGAQRATDLEVS